MMVSLLTNESGQHTFMVSFVVPFRCSWTVMSAVVHIPQTLPAASLSHHLSKILLIAFIAHLSSRNTVNSKTTSDLYDHVIRYWIELRYVSKTLYELETRNNISCSFSANVQTLESIAWISIVTKTHRQTHNNKNEHIQQTRWRSSLTTPPKKNNLLLKFFVRNSELAWIIHHTKYHHFLAVVCKSSLKESWTSPPPSESLEDLAGHNGYFEWY